MEIPQKQIKGKVIQLYSNEFKRAVCEEYLNGTASKMDIQRKYRICYKSAIVTLSTASLTFREPAGIRVQKLNPPTLARNPFYFTSNFWFSRCSGC